MKRGVKKLANHSIAEERELLDMSVYEFYFHLESIKASQEK